LPVARPAPSRAWRGAICALLVLLVGHGYASEETTGVALKFASLKSDWKFSDGTRNTKLNSLILTLEQQATTSLTAGGSIGYHNLWIDDQGGGNSTSFDVQNIEIYLRQGYSLSDSITLQGLLSFAWYTGSANDNDDNADLDWTQVGLELGVNYRHGNLGFTPYVSYTNLDGDTSGLENGGGFELKDQFGQGVRFDIYVDSTSFVGIELKMGAQTGGYLSFVKRY
jgi:hypothetical protein